VLIFPQLNLHYPFGCVFVFFAVTVLLRKRWLTMIIQTWVCALLMSCFYYINFSQMSRYSAGSSTEAETGVLTEAETGVLTEAETGVLTEAETSGSTIADTIQIDTILLKKLVILYIMVALSLTASSYLLERYQLKSWLSQMSLD